MGQPSNPDPWMGQPSNVDTCFPLYLDPQKTEKQGMMCTQNVVRPLLFESDVFVAVDQCRGPVLFLTFTRCSLIEEDCTLNSLVVGSV